MLPCCVATVDSKVASGHEAAGVADKEDRCTSVFGGLAETAEHVLFWPLGLALWELDE